MIFFNLKQWNEVGKPDIRNRHVITQRKCESEWPAISIPHARDPCDLSSTQRNTYTQLKSAYRSRTPLKHKTKNSRLLLSAY